MPGVNESSAHLSVQKHLLVSPQQTRGPYGLWGTVLMIPVTISKSRDKMALSSASLWSGVGVAQKRAGGAGPIVPVWNPAAGGACPVPQHHCREPPCTVTRVSGWGLSPTTLLSMDRPSPAHPCLPSAGEVFLTARPACLPWSCCFRGCNGLNRVPQIPMLEL